jgi:hypothetical protein
LVAKKLALQKNLSTIAVVLDMLESVYESGSMTISPTRNSDLIKPLSRKFNSLRIKEDWGSLVSPMQCPSDSSFMIAEVL